MSTNIIGGVHQQYYHTIPNELDVITTTPTREAIFKSLSQIEYDKFPEFILDILVKVEGHTPLDVTDGQGDEKQDILTLNSKGERCLTQCKHTINYKSHYNGDDLDLLVVACMRKDCKEAIFVTNSDITPQGKRYINDKEYNRGIKNQNDYREITYWNGFKIWDKIKNNPDIINKWFSGLGQVHGLRSFKFDLTVQELPLSELNNKKDAFNEFINTLLVKPWIKEITKDMHYVANISDEYNIHLKRWFQFSGNLDINFISPDESIDFINKPMYALTIEVILTANSKKYFPKSIKEEIVKKLTVDVLPNLNNNRWWHITTSQIKSIIYLHDISEPREIDLASASTFIKTNLTETEDIYCSLQEDIFEITDKEDDSIWLHKKTGIQIVQMFEQKINPIEQYNNQIQQYNQLESIREYNYFFIKNIDSSMMMRIRRLFNFEWVALKQDEDTLIWAIPPSFDEKQIRIVHNKIKVLGLVIMQVKREDINLILNNVKNDLVPSFWMYTSNRSNISYPIMLNKRILWLSKELELKQNIGLEKTLELLKYKYAFENKYGYDYMEGETNQQINSSEVQNILYDFFTFRGNRMLDIAMFNNPLTISIRFKEGLLLSSNSLALNYLNEFNAVYEEINKILN